MPQLSTAKFPRRCLFDFFGNLQRRRDAVKVLNARLWTESQSPCRGLATNTAMMRPAESVMGMSVLKVRVSALPSEVGANNSQPIPRNVRTPMGADELVCAASITSVDVR